MIRCVAFDFDGTLVRSNAIKRESFFEVVAHIHGADKELNDLFGAKFEGDRYELFAELSRRITARGMTDEVPDGLQLARAYGKMCQEKICSCGEVSGAGATLVSLKDRGISSYIVSATPERDLEPIVTARRLDMFFKAVLGRPGDKAGHLGHILAQEGIEPLELVMVGDGADDQAAAETVGCHFIAIANSENPDPPRADITTDDLHALPGILLGLDDGSAGIPASIERSD
jgi:phosphoglycolate phosphatase-like HAD superfamily hydrolase